MNGTLTIGGLFLEGLLSFFSPCVLPLVPLYLGYLTAGISETASPKERRIRTAVLTFFFVLGICTVFFIAGLGSGALRSFFEDNKILFSLTGGMILVLFGLFSLDVIRIPLLEGEHRFTAPLKGKYGPVQAYLLGFFFSFAWSPCIGPLLASAILASASAPSAAMSWLYMGSYALGFICVFLLLGIFTEEVLAFLKKNKGVVRWTKLLGGAVVLGMGIYMFAQGVNDLHTLQNAQPVAVEQSGDTDIEKYNVALETRDGQTVELKDYKGQKLILNFFATWCHYCKEELPYLQQMSETRDDVKIILIADPGFGSEGTKEDVIRFLDENGYTMEVLFDISFQMVRSYQVTGFPTTFIVKEDGNFLGYVPGYVDEAMMEQILEQADQQG